MNSFLGQDEVRGADNPYHNYTREEWALKYIMDYGSIDGEHHKSWVMDQVARILKGTPVIVYLARWHRPEYFLDSDEYVRHERARYEYNDKENGIVGEYRYVTGEPTQIYHDWVTKCRGEYDEASGFYECDYDEGIAP